MSKKGISPLIGTVLLVAIVIAMILLIMPWITNTIKSQQEKATESLVAMDCATDLDLDLVLDSASGAVSVSNRGGTVVTKLIFKTYTPTGGFAATQHDSIERTATTKAVEPYGATDSGVICDGTSIGKVEVIATLDSGAVCAGAAEVSC